MDPLVKAVKRKGWHREETVQTEDGPLHKIDIGGAIGDEDGVPDDADDLAQAAPEGGFGGVEETFENDDDGPLSPEEQEDPALTAARAKFKQTQMETGEDPEEWEFPEDEPDEDEAMGNLEYFEKNKGDLMRSFSFSPDEVVKYAKDVEGEGVYPEHASIFYLRKRFGLGEEEAQVLRQQFRDAWSDPENGQERAWKWKPDPGKD